MDSAPAAPTRPMTWARVGYQGEPGAYSEEAALAIRPDATTIGFTTFSRAFDAAVLPVENSLGGIVQEVNDLVGWQKSKSPSGGSFVSVVQTAEDRARANFAAE